MKKKYRIFCSMFRNGLANNRAYLPRFANSVLVISLGLIFTLLFSLKCTDRSRRNPLDPQNDKTLGRPVGLAVISKLDTVILTWKPVQVDQLQAYIIFRSTARNENFQEIAVVPGAISSYTDTAIVYETEYTYRISAQMTGYETELSEPVHITPGPTFSWVVEAASGKIIKLTHDCRHILLEIEYMGYPERIVANSTDGTIWFYDEIFNQIYHLSAYGEVLQVISGYNQITDMDLDQTNGCVWFCEQDRKRLVKLKPDGDVQFEIDLLNPRSVSVNSISGGCWVADAGGREIFYFSPSGRKTQVLAGDFKAVTSLALHLASGWLWVADSANVSAYDTNQNGELVIAPIQNFDEPRLVVVNQKTGDCWVADKNSVAKYSPAGELAFQTKGFYRPLSIDVNPFNGSCLVADYYQARFMKISRDGELVEQLATSQYPSSVAVQYFPGK